MSDDPVVGEGQVTNDGQATGEGFPRSEALERVRLAALDAFPDPEIARTVEWYVRELSYKMRPSAMDTPLDMAARRAAATCEATGDTALTLLCKLEDYLESVLAGRLASRKPERSKRR